MVSSLSLLLCILRKLAKIIRELYLSSSYKVLVEALSLLLNACYITGVS